MKLSCLKLYQSFSHICLFEILQTCVVLAEQKKFNLAKDYIGYLSKGVGEKAIKNKLLRGLEAYPNFFGRDL